MQKAADFVSCSDITFLKLLIFLNKGPRMFILHRASRITLRSCVCCMVGAAVVVEEVVVPALSAPPGTRRSSPTPPLGALCVLRGFLGGTCTPSHGIYTPGVRCPWGLGALVLPGVVRTQTLSFHCSASQFQSRAASLPGALGVSQRF